MSKPSLTDLGCGPATVVLTTRLDGKLTGTSFKPLNQLNPRLREVHYAWAYCEIKRWNRGEVDVWSFRHDHFAGERAMAHIETDIFTEVSSSLLHPGISVRFLYLVRGDLRQTRGFTYQFATTTFDEKGEEAAGHHQEGNAYRDKDRRNIETIFDLVQRLRTEQDWSLHWTTLRYSLFDPEVNKWLI